MQEVTTCTEKNLQTLYCELLPTVYRVAYTYMHNRFDSEDAAQEAFLRLARYRGSFPDERRIKAWLIVTVSNVCKDMLRRRHRQDMPLDECRELPAPEAAGGEVLAAVSALPENYRTAVYLHYYEGYAVHEIAAAMRRPEGTVKAWLSRARALLKLRLEVKQDD